MINSICLVRLSALGDVLMMVPLIRTLQEHLPEAHLTWIISKPAYYLVEGMEGVSFIVIDKPKSLTDYWRFKKQMQHQTFDVLLAPQASLRTNLLYPLIHAKRKIGYDALRAKDLHGLFVKERIAPGMDHTLEGFLKFAQPLGVTQKVIRWDLPIADEDYAWAHEHLPSGKPILIINPAASKPERSWPIKSYIALLQKAQERWPLDVVLTGGPGDYDRALADEILNVIPATDLVGKTKPKQLLAVLSKATAILCPDTGPSHMGAAVNTPTIALHAVTNPCVSGPYRYAHLVVNKYPDALKKVLGLTLEQHVWGTHVHGDEAMKLILVDDVMEKMELIFGPITSSDKHTVIIENKTS